MAKVNYPSVGAPYRGFTGEVRGWLNRIASYVDDCPDAKAAIGAQIDALVAQKEIPTVGYTAPVTP